MKQNYRVSIFNVFLAGAGIFLIHSTSSQAFNQNVVISEIQIAGDSVTDEFVELYNPSSNDISLKGWKLSKKTRSGSQSTLVSDLNGSIPSHGYFLITHPEYTSDLGDSIYTTTASLSDDNSIVLYSDNGQTIVDVVGMGESESFEFQSTLNPGPGQSLERKAQQISDQSSMTTGTDKDWGNGYDSDVNSFDFILREIPDPQNSQSIPEFLPASPTPMPTIIPEPTISPTPFPSQTPEPTIEPSPSPTPIVSPVPRKKEKKVLCEKKYHLIEWRSFGKTHVISLPRVYCVKSERQKLNAHR